METSLIELLEKLKSIDPYVENYESPNVFFMLEIDNKEVLMCRMLAAIIEPNGVHSLGTLPLKLFLEQLGRTFDENILKQAYVVTEEKIAEERRVDIVIHINNEVIPIEAKINASDQPKQLSDYYCYYENNGYKIDKIYYLTPLGKEPSKESAVDLKIGEQIETISFSKTIYSFLNKLSKLEALSKEFKYIILNYKAVTEDMSNEYKIKNEVINKVEEAVNSDVELRKALLKLLKFSDDTRAVIEKQYFEESLKESGFSDYSVEIITDNESMDFSSIDKHAKYAVVHNGETVAYLCVETNLYIAKKFLNEEIPERWSKYPDGDYAWTYILKNNKKWKLKDIDLNFFDQEIDWSLYL